MLIDSWHVNLKVIRRTQTRDDVTAIDRYQPTNHLVRMLLLAGLGIFWLQTCEEGPHCMLTMILAFSMIVWLMLTPRSQIDNMIDRTCRTPSTTQCLYCPTVRNVFAWKVPAGKEKCR